MKTIRLLGGSLILAALMTAAPARADESFAKVAEEVNPKLVKIFGAGGLKGLAAYGTGFFVSPDGYILTTCSPLLETSDLRVHLPDGTKYRAKVVAMEPELDMALLKIGTKERPIDPCPPTPSSTARAASTTPRTPATST
jgi:serine protease Do